ncbi:Phosphorus acquisition-controlling protein [Cercospora beticola]|uniref:Phosphorus acquisition-controlling protein n=1 Tax=Cercospora beticola TaxID=122368 RepID=A0A2G5IAV6_CERBT|nr:Phosphorus acquisition-controlling protein [Cercospora beticola]PIB01925.1 Phosphorus acquisition-controlling protein [Cercospora beticola]WPA96672.1 hypothetical protein RHO25_001280 [Cercospora beticola]CAK1354975.1 unnamed protein product [Cercospora beticola]
MDASAEQWSRSVDEIDPLTLNASMDDLGNLFEFGDIDLNNLPNIDTSASYDEHMQHTNTHPSTPFSELNEPHTLPGGNAQDFAGQQRFGPSASAEQAQRHLQSSQFPSDVAFQQTMQQHDFHPSQSFQFQAMPGYSMHQQIPPTPNSYEMHGEPGRFLQSQLDSQQRALLEQKYHLRKEDAIAFTPMVSPAGTPQYNAQPEFTIPGAYFSPLTSPMLHAQTSQQAQSQSLQHGYYTNPSTAPSSNATSPLNASVDVDMLADEAESTEAPTRKSTRRKVPTPRSAGPLARVKQSPIQKAIKRKSGTILSSLPPSREADVNLEVQRSKSTQPTSTGLSIPRSDSSATGSISPEPLSEALMGPPPRPSSSRTNSPAIRAQHSNGVANSMGAAATPKSLLSMGRGAATRSEPKSHQTAGDAELEDLQLPAAADQSVDGPPQTQVTTVSNDDTPRLSARKTPKLGPTSTPSSARLASAALSPAIVGSPMTASTPGALLKERKESKSSRGGKKRGSISGGGSNLVSPALRPRISPSIKPLLPEGAALHSPTHALLLASKSNYQNLLEGNQLPGVNYPESLSTGLTSKRTSHKVAEQGRRNRINEALKEMQSLLPKGKENNTRDGSPEVNAEDSKESKEDALAKSNSSKAATVESANEYIRKLQRENAALLILKKENEEMKKRLQAAQNGSGSGSENSDDKSPGESVEATS